MQGPDGVVGPNREVSATNPASRPPLVGWQAVYWREPHDAHVLACILDFLEVTQPLSKEARTIDVRSVSALEGHSGQEGWTRNTLAGRRTLGI